MSLKRVTPGCNRCTERHAVLATGEANIVREDSAGLKGELVHSGLRSETVTGIETEYVDHAGFRFAILTLAPSGDRPATLGPTSLAGLETAV